MKIRASMLALAAVFLLSSCGTTNPVDEVSESAPHAISDDCAEDSTKTTTGPVSMTDSFGRTVELDEPAERVAVLEWQQTEDLLTLCVQPVAVADAEGYSTWVTAEKLPDGVKDVGDRNEPNLEALYATNPDLVIVEAASGEDEIIAQLEKYGVPVLAMPGADAEDAVGEMITAFEMIAEATGRTERADEVIDGFNAHLEEAREEIAAAELETDEFVYFDGWIDGGNVAIRPFGKGSLVGDLGEELGLKNAWTGEVDPVYGLGQTDIEGMSELGEATFLHTGTVDPDGDIFAELKKNRAWTTIPAVSEGRMHAFEEGVWTFGGPRSSEQIIDAYVDVLTEKS